MYEPVNGPRRLSGALERAAADPDRLARLADVLNYLPDQLQEDIRALSDHLSRGAFAGETGHGDRGHP